MQRGVFSPHSHFSNCSIRRRRRNDQKAPKSFICSSSAHPQRPRDAHVFPKHGYIISLEPPLLLLLLHLHEKSTKIGTAHKSAVLLMHSWPCAAARDDGYIHFCCTLAERNTRFLGQDALRGFSELVKHPDCVKATHQFTYVRRLLALMRLNPL